MLKKNNSQLQRYASDECAPNQIYKECTQIRIAENIGMDKCSLPLSTTSFGIIGVHHYLHHLTRFGYLQGYALFNKTLKRGTNKLMKRKSKQTATGRWIM